MVVNIIVMNMVSDKSKSDIKKLYLSFDENEINNLFESSNLDFVSEVKL